MKNTFTTVETMLASRHTQWFYVSLIEQPTKKVNSFSSKIANPSFILQSCQCFLFSTANFASYCSSVYVCGRGVNHRLIRGWVNVNGKLSEWRSGRTEEANRLDTLRKQYKSHYDIWLLKPSNNSHLVLILYSLVWHNISRV